MSSQDWTTASAPGKTPQITSIFDFSAEALGQLKVYLEQAGLNLPISNIVGFQQFTFQPATTINTSEATTSTSFTDLATVGPSIQGLSKGKYAIFFGCQGQPTSPSAGVMSFTVTNVAAANDDDSIVMSPGSNMSASRVVLKTLSVDGGNGVQAQYRSSNGDSCLLQKRWMIAAKYGNI